MSLSQSLARPPSTPTGAAEGVYLFVCVDSPAPHCACELGISACVDVGV